MHRVDRGPEPEGLAAVRSRHTLRWVDYHRNHVGKEPGRYWNVFRYELSQVFFDLCAYCEEYCDGEVDHFRPKSRFPEKTYEWSNWVFACHTCNNIKGKKWPPGGYVNPCAKTKPAYPESYFTFDTLTGEILPKEGLTSGRHEKAKQMIDELKLNEHHHLKKRRAQLDLVSQVISNDSGDGIATVAFLKKVTRRSERLSSVTRVILAENDYPVDVD